jgi:hypothetical protein
MVVNFFRLILIVLPCLFYAGQKPNQDTTSIKDTISIKSQYEYAPGIVSVKFDKTISRIEAEHFLKNLGLNAKSFDLFKSIHWVTVIVPIGLENKWVDSLKTYPIIKYSELDYISHIN